MIRILFILFLVIPLIEITILIEIGQIFGIGYTIALVVGTAILGAALFRQQGLSTLAKVQMSVNEGNLPATELTEGLALLIAGALLLTPGFFTDIFGFLILIPPLRNHIARNLLANFIQSHINTPYPDSAPESGRIIEAEHWKSDSK